MITTSEFAKEVGQKQMAQRLGVGVTAVNNAVARGCFPSSWYLVLQDMAKDKGLSCPPALFRMKEPDASRYVE